MKKTLSIIIPAYNIEKYINQALTSFLNAQSCLEDIEILVINDGSRDNTEKLAAGYARQYPDVVRVVNKENGGHGSTINRGIEEAAGTYFKVVDGDDWVETENFAELVNVLKTQDADMILSPYYVYQEQDGSRQLVNQFEGYHEKCDFQNVCGGFPRIQMHGVVFRTDLLRRHQIRLDEGLFYVDAEYTCFPIPHIKSVDFFQKPVYVYRMGTQEQSMNAKNLWARRDQHRSVLMHMVEFYMETDTSPERKMCIRHAVEEMINTQYMIYLRGTVCKETKKELMRFDRELSEKSAELYRNVRMRRVRLLRNSRFCLYRACAVR